MKIVRHVVEQRKTYEIPLSEIWNELKDNQMIDFNIAYNYLAGDEMSSFYGLNFRLAPEELKAKLETMYKLPEITSIHHEKNSDMVSISTFETRFEVKPPV